MYRQQPVTRMNTENELFNEKFRDDTIFSEICRDIVRLPMEENVSFSNKVFEEVIQGRLIPLMKINEDFERYFEKVMFGGSSGKDIKIGYPNDYDLNIIIELPITYTTKKVEPRNWNDNFITIDAEIDSSTRDGIFCQRLMDGYYLDQDKFYNWICRVFSTAIKRYRKKYGQQDYIITKRQTDYFKIDIESRNDGNSISFWIVPCLLFSDSLEEFRESKYEWLAVSIPLPDYVEKSNVLWRPSFYEDEKEYLSGQIKPQIRMLKKLDDEMGWELKSYFIETLFLHELDNEEFEDNYMEASRTAIFIYMLKRLREVLQTDCLLSYWNRNINLCYHRTREYKLRIRYELNDLIYTIEGEIEDNPEILLDYFSNSDDDSDNSYDDTSESD